jgi:hypothetical protein
MIAERIEHATTIVRPTRAEMTTPCLSRAVRTVRSVLVAAGATLLLAAPVLAGPPAPRPTPPLGRGAQLVAVRDVDLRDVQISQGSHVVVVEVARQDGTPVAVSLELKDGHVVRGVPIHIIEQSFRRLP